jgi:hypothetical protein
MVYAAHLGDVIHVRLPRPFVPYLSHVADPLADVVAEIALTPEIVLTALAMTRLSRLTARLTAPAPKPARKRRKPRR